MGKGRFSDYVNVGDHFSLDERFLVEADGEAIKRLTAILKCTNFF
jgi:hypothetical protein